MEKPHKKRWYVIQVISGFETKAANSLRKHIKLHAMKQEFGEILIPTEAVIEIKKGKRKKSERKFFPGYILINMVMNERNWHLIRHVPKITGFVGGTPDNPSPISNNEVNIIMNKLQKIGDKPRPKTIFDPGETIRVNDGPFIDFNGIVEKVDYEKNRLKVSVSIFGRSTPVELDFSQVEKI